MDPQIVLLATLLLIQVAMLISMRTVSRRTDWQIPRLERKVDLLLKHLNLAFEDKAGEMVRPLLLAGKKLDAIKEYRRITGVGLKDAKDAVEAIEWEIRSEETRR
jgi:ribosomal protein L7/L12